MSQANVVVLDYGMGNRRSVEKALERVGAEVSVTRDPDVLRAASGIVIPGVGAFPHAMTSLRSFGLVDLIAELADAGVPMLGICLGMQLLFESSVEGDGTEGLGLLEGDVRLLRAPGLKLPHIGWSLVRFSGSSPLTDGLPDEAAFYHVHSFAAHVAAASDVLGVAEYGEQFASVVARGSLYGVQFHPEKSSTHGLRLLSNFVAVCAEARSGAAA